MRIAHTPHFSFKVCAAAGRVCGVATHAVGGGAGYGLLESDISSIAAIDCNDGNVKGFVGYKYPTYACYGLLHINYIVY